MGGVVEVGDVVEVGEVESTIRDNMVFHDIIFLHVQNGLIVVLAIC